MGCWYSSTPGRDPTTARHGDFWLLGYPPGPVRLSLANLATSDSSEVAILMASLVRTPSQHGARTNSRSQSQILRHNQPPVAGLQEPPHSQLTIDRLCVYIGCRRFFGDNNSSCNLQKYQVDNCPSEEYYVSMQPRRSV
uniref:Uncharacterized protein n=1 Tax=Trichogramma kaykai TaxID=54128 RepID=A0ABD2X8A5_9HYME